MGYEIQSLTVWFIDGIFADVPRTYVAWAYITT